MEISFIPSPDVVVILNTLLDKFENRGHALKEAEENYEASLNMERPPRSIKVSINDLPLPFYFSQTDPEPRLIANKQLQDLADHNLINLTWLPGETNHILQSISLANGTRNAQHESLYQLLKRTPISDQRARLEALLLAEKFRYPKDDWRAHALIYILGQLSAGKSPAPFSLSDSNLNLDLLAILQALPTLRTETPYRVFSVRLFNDSKRFEDLKPSLVRLVRCANLEWKSLTSEDLLRELNLVANPGYIHLAGNWELTDINGQIINLDSFIPSLGFSTSQITSVQKITIHAESVLCIENLTSFHQYTRLAEYEIPGTEQVDRYTCKHQNNGTRSTSHATLCLMGNPSPSIRHLLRLIPKKIPIYVWSDMDYGGFKILSQLRKQVSPRIQAYLMDIATFNAYAHFARPLTASDVRGLKHLILNPNLKDVRPTIDHLVQRGLKLEQEAIRI